MDYSAIGFFEFAENLDFLNQHDRFDLVVNRNKGAEVISRTFRYPEQDGTSLFLKEGLEYTNPSMIRPHQLNSAPSSNQTNDKHQ